MESGKRYLQSFKNQRGARTAVLHRLFTCSASGPSTEQDDQQAEGAPQEEALLAVLDIQPAAKFVQIWFVLARHGRVARRAAMGAKTAAVSNSGTKSVKSRECGGGETNA